MQFGRVIRKIQHRLAGGGVDCGPAGGPQRFRQVALGGIARLGQIPETQMQVVENVSDVAVR